LKLALELILRRDRGELEVARLPVDGPLDQPYGGWGGDSEIGCCPASETRDEGDPGGIVSASFKADFDYLATGAIIMRAHDGAFAVSYTTSHSDCDKITGEKLHAHCDRLSWRFR